MRRIALLVLLTALSLALVAACSTARQREPIIKSIRIDSPKLARGEKAYMLYCDKCHPGGDKGLGFAIRNKPLPEFLVKLQVRMGFGAMPSFSDELLLDDQLDDVVDYLKLLRKQ